MFELKKSGENNLYFKQSRNKNNILKNGYTNKISEFIISEIDSFIYNVIDRFPEI